MKMLSLWQPWASLIAYGLKQYETRHWRMGYHGPLAIHATKKQPVCISAELTRIGLSAKGDARFLELLQNLPLPQGQIVAIAGSATCYRMLDQQPDREGQIQKFTGQWQVLIPAMSAIEIACGDWQEGRYGIKLLDVKRIYPLPYKGAQGLINLPDNVVEELRSRVIKP